MHRLSSLELVRFAMGQFAMATVVVLIANQNVWSQTDNDVAYWLDRDTTLVVNVEDVPETYRRIKSLDLFRNPRFLKALEMLSDERFPIIDAKNAELVTQRLFALESMVRETEQMSIVVHQIDESEFRWSVFLRAQPRHLDLVQAELMGLGDQYRALQNAVQRKMASAGMGGLEDLNGLEGQQKRDDLGEEKSEATAERKRVDGSITVGDYRLKRVGDWLLLSNDESFVSQIVDRVDNEEFRSLGKSRKYQGIVRRHSSLNDSAGKISVYGNPYRMRYFMPYRTQSSWELAEIDEMPSCGFNFVITDPDNDAPSESRPIVLADATIKFTKPTIGLAKMYEHYQPMEIPSLAVEPTELIGFARDDDAICVESGRVFDLKYGDGAAKSWWNRHFEETGMNQFTDAVKRRSAFYDLRFVDGESFTVDRPGLMSIEKVKDPDAMFRFADGVARLAIQRYGREIGFDDNGSVVRWISPEAKFAETSGLDGFARDDHSRADFYNCYHDAYILTDQWWVQGDMPVVEDQVALLNQEGGEDFRFVVQDLVDDLSMRIGSGAQPYMIRYFTESSWVENLNNIEESYASMGEFLNVPMNWDSASIKRIDASLSYKSQLGGLQIGQLGIQNLDGVQLQIVQGLDSKVEAVEGATESEPSESRLPTKIEILEIQKTYDNNQQVQEWFLESSPTRIGERSEDGYRIKIENREDLKLAIKIMILKSVSESFPRQLFQYSKTDDYLQVTMGVYPKRNPDPAAKPERDDQQN